MQVEISMYHMRCYRCRRWHGAESVGAPCGQCALDDIRALQTRISQLLRSNAALRGALKRKGKRR